MDAPLVFFGLSFFRAFVFAVVLCYEFVIQDARPEAGFRHQSAAASIKKPAGPPKPSFAQYSKTGEEQKNTHESTKDIDRRGIRLAHHCDAGSWSNHPPVKPARLRPRMIAG